MDSSVYSVGEFIQTLLGEGLLLGKDAEKYLKKQQQQQHCSFTMNYYELR